MANNAEPSFEYDLGRGGRPLVRSDRGVVASGHQLASLAGLDILRRGGNAVDAGIAAGICINVVHHDMTTFSGVAPIMLYLAEEQRVVSISGLGRWPRATSLDHFWDRQDGLFQEGVMHCVLPAAADAWATALERYGTMSLGQVMEAAIGFAQGGFPVHDFMAYNFERGWEAMRKWPATAALVAPQGNPLRPGETFVQADLAATLTRMVEEESAASGDRTAGIRAARDRFYRGDIAREFVAFSEQHGGFFTMNDFEQFAVQEEPTVQLEYKGYELHACGPWCQGPVLPMALAVLKHFDLPAMGHNSPEYLHTVLGALDLAFADREYYIGDPEFVDVPMDELVSESYAARRAELIKPGRAFTELPPPGNPREGTATRDDYRWPPAGDWETVGRGVSRPAVPEEPDTSYVCAIDSRGNMFSATPSDTFTTYLSSPIVPGLGLPMSGRGKQNRLDPDHPAVLAPWKRPRLTPSPALVLKDGKPFMTIGTPGGDTQPQSMLQVLLNVLEFGMDLQSAVEAPRVVSSSFPASFYPHGYRPGLARVEGRIAEATVEALKRWGHRVERWPDKSWRAGSVLVATIDSNGRLEAGADHRREGMALGW